MSFRDIPPIGNKFELRLKADPFDPTLQMMQSGLQHNLQHFDAH